MGTYDFSICERRCPHRSLLQALELFDGDSQLAENLVKQRRADFPASMNGNCDEPSVRMNPLLMAAGLTFSLKSQSKRGSPKLFGSGARHARFRSCLEEEAALAPRIQWRSFRRPTRD